MGAIDDRTMPNQITRFFRQNRAKWNWEQRAIWPEAPAEAQSPSSDDEEEDEDDEEEDNDDKDDDDKNENDHVGVTEKRNMENEDNDEEETFITGSCGCGQSKYRIRLDGPTEMQHCYCRLCRRLSGGPFQTWLPIPKRAFDWVISTGDDNDDNTTITCQEPPMQQYVTFGKRHVCNNCGGVLTIVYTDQEDTIWAAAGALDDITLPAKTSDEFGQYYLHSVTHICCRYKQSWYAIPADGHSRIPEAFPE
mmetsp:Transcript_21249/g.27438  ORF Transcript_21249/g.27438 Transcript_21249/m.27438 type:complete len:250 (-) Transcript_21249:62-811(-)